MRWFNIKEKTKVTYLEDIQDDYMDLLSEIESRCGYLFDLYILDGEIQSFINEFEEVLIGKNRGIEQSVKKIKKKHLKSSGFFRGQAK